MLAFRQNGSAAARSDEKKIAVAFADKQARPTRSDKILSYPRELFDHLHELRWFVVEFQTTDGQWHVYGHREQERILGRGTTQTQAWQAAVMAAESIR